MYLRYTVTFTISLFLQTLKKYPSDGLPCFCGGFNRLMRIVTVVEAVVCKGENDAARTGRGPVAALPPFGVLGLLGLLDILKRGNVSDIAETFINSEA